MDKHGGLPLYSAIHVSLQAGQICSFGLDSIYAAPTNDPVVAQLATLGEFMSGPFTAYLDGYHPSVSYLGEGEDTVHGYAYHLERTAFYLSQYEKENQ